MIAITRLDPLLPSRAMYFGISAERAVQLAIENINEGGSGHLLAIAMSRMPQLKDGLNVLFYDFIIGIAVEITNSAPVLTENLDDYPPIMFLGLYNTDLLINIEVAQG